MHLWSTGPLPVQTEVEAFWYLNLTPEQAAAYERFREHLTQAEALLEGHDDRWTLLRFLKARQWDVERAAVMYGHMADWRRQHKPDELFKTFTFPEIDEVLPLYPHFYHKTDKFGRPVYIELLGRTDAAKLLEATTLERLMDYHICEWESLKTRIFPACSSIAGKPVITKSVVLDLKGMSMKMFGSAAHKVLKTVSSVDQDCYPEHLGQMFIINTPMFFRAIWAVVNPMLEERTRRKIVILGSDYLPTLLQLIPEDNLPTELGGKSQAPSDLKQHVGPWVELLAQQDAKQQQIVKQTSEPVLIGRGEHAILDPGAPGGADVNGAPFISALSEPTAD